MALSYYLPRADKEKAIWLKNFSIKFNSYATSFGFVAADATAIAADSAALTYMLDLLEVFKTEAKERTAYKDSLVDGPLSSNVAPLPTLPVLAAAPPAVAPGIFIRVTAVVNRIKAHPAYTQAIGQDLGIIGAESAEKLAVEKPALIITKNGGALQVKYKRGDADGLRLFCKRTGESEFSLLAVINKPVYEDIRPNKVTGQPETREYLAYYMQNDKQIGQSSDTISIVI